MKHTFDCDKIKGAVLKRGDFCLIACLLLAAGLMAAFFCFGPGQKEGRVVVIEQDGEEIFRLPLTREQTIRIPSESGYNSVQITPGGVWVAQADCPDQICVKQGKISASGESIVCLPHRLVIRLEGGG